MDSKGKLYLCATPIGNMKDITLRVLETLQDVDLIAAEDTRQTLKILNHYEIKTPLTSYHEHNKRAKGEVLISRLLSGENIALVTDAGTPSISDPGEDLVKECIAKGISVTSLPGPSAVITALSLSGVAAKRFVFEGFLPQDKKERKKTLAALSKEARTIVLYEAPHRILKTLAELSDALGEERHIKICRELTKIHEEVLSFELSEAIEYFKENEPRGEIVVLVEGADEEALNAAGRASFEELSVEEHMERYLSEGLSEKDAMKAVAGDRGVSKREIYEKVKIQGWH